MAVQAVKEFLKSPSPQMFKRIPSRQRIKLIQECLKDDIQDSNKVAKCFVSVCASVKDNKDALEQCTDAILRPPFEIANCKEEGLVSSLLVHMGLLKGEEKIQTVKDLSGPLMALEHAVKQSYFPKRLKSFFVAFIAKPNKLLDSCSDCRHKLLQTLYQI